jgi:predicted RNA binding protein YcfA (HicA-like mRNA interferase family)
VGILPVLRARQVVSALVRAGFEVHHQTGSHLVLKHAGPPPRRVTVPMHTRDVKPGTLRSIIREAGMSVEEFAALL